jgi:hypothetical protein
MWLSRSLPLTLTQKKKSVRMASARYPRQTDATHYANVERSVSCLIDIVKCTTVANTNVRETSTIRCHSHRPHQPTTTIKIGEETGPTTIQQTMLNTKEENGRCPIPKEAVPHMEILHQSRHLRLMVAAGAAVPPTSVITSAVNLKMLLPWQLDTRHHRKARKREKEKAEARANTVVHAAANLDLVGMNITRTELYSQPPSCPRLPASVCAKSLSRPRMFLP